MDGEVVGIAVVVLVVMVVDVVHGRLAWRTDASRVHARRSEGRSSLEDDRERWTGIGNFGSRDRSGRVPGRHISEERRARGTARATAGRGLVGTGIVRIVLINL
jgi:hypothetical protein